MRIIFVAASSSLNDQLILALKNNGADLTPFNERQNFVLPFQDYIGWTLIRKVKWLKRKNNDFLNNKLLELAIKTRPDFVLTTKGTTLQKRILDKLKELNIKSVNWFPENIYHPTYKKWFEENYQNFDYFLSFDPSVPQKYKSQKNEVLYLPFGVDPEFYKVTEISEADKKFYSCDVSFVGAVYPEREEILKVVASNGMDLKIFGWAGWEKTDLAPYYKGSLNTTEMSKLFQCSKICLNSNLKPQNGGANTRTFEIPAAGGFQLSDISPDLDNLFEIGKEIEVYKNSEELIQKIRHYLNNEALRKKIAQAGHERILDDHTLFKRAKTIINLVQRD